MYATMLGREGFRQGMDLYFKRHDGQAVTTDDFFAAMADANPSVDISALKTWYSQAGTPTVTVETSFDASAKTFTFKASQSLPSTPDSGGDGPKKPQLVPIRVGLLGASGKDLALEAISQDGGAPRPLGGATEVVLPFAAMASTFVLHGVSEEPVVASILRDFSAPVHLKARAGPRTNGAGCAPCCCRNRTAPPPPHSLPCTHTPACRCCPSPLRLSSLSSSRTTATRSTASRRRRRSARATLRSLNPFGRSRRSLRISLCCVAAVASRTFPSCDDLAMSCNAGSRLVLRVHQAALAAGAAPNPRADASWPVRTAKPRTQGDPPFTSRCACSASASHHLTTSGGCAWRCAQSSVSSSFSCITQALISALKAVLVAGTKKDLDRVFVAEARITGE